MTYVLLFAAAAAEHTPPGRLVLNLPTPDGWKAELTWWVVICQGGLPVCRQSPIGVVTEPAVKHQFTSVAAAAAAATTNNKEHL